MSKVVKIYCAGPWFTPNQRMVQTEFEDYLRSKEGFKTYFPQHDGVKLEPEQFHDPKLRESVFLDNIRNIDNADLVIANLDGRDGFQDTGTCYEVGYAMALGIPVIGYQKDYDGKMNDHMSSVLGGLYCTCTGLKDLDLALNNFDLVKKNNISYDTVKGSKVLYIAPDNTQENVDKGTKVASVLVECFGKDFRWIDKLSNSNIANYTDSMFKDVDFMVAVIDDRHPLVSWMMGQCFARKIPIVSYTNYDYGINLMLALSILSHVKGIEELKDLVHSIKRDGIESVQPFDNSTVKVF